VACSRLEQAGAEAWSRPSAACTATRRHTPWRLGPGYQRGERGSETDFALMLRDLAAENSSNPSSAPAPFCATRPLSKGLDCWMGSRGHHASRLTYGVYGHASGLGLGVAPVPRPRALKPSKELEWLRGQRYQCLGGSMCEPGANDANIVVPRGSALGC
jgi:hypothetical protein